MATTLYKPMLYLVPAFDATADFTFTFSYLGGEIFRNTILIKNNATNQEVYRNTVVSRQLRHTVPAGTLRNGTVYNVSIQVIDGNNDSSPFSDPIVVYCYTTPTFGFTNLVEDQIVSSSFFEAQLNYSQPEGEILNQYTVFLYNSNRIEITNSGNLYDTENLRYIVNNLVNGDYYYLRATGRTLHNMDIDTGYVFFNVRYINPPVYSLLGLENQAEIGAISISPHLVVVTGTSNPDPPKFINNIEVDLRDEGSWVKFDSGFNIANDFTIQMIGRDFNDYSQILILDNKQYKITLEYRYGTFAGNDEEIAYFELKAYNPLTNYILLSNYIDKTTPNENIYIWMRRKNNVFELKAEVL